MFIIFSLAACKDPFAERMQASRDAGYAKFSQIKKGLPYFRHLKMDPIWSFSNEQEAARVRNYQMQDQNGLQQGQELFRKQPTFVAFFFSSCQTFCPFLFKNLKSIEKHLGSKELPQFVAISVNPEQDTPATLKKYEKRFLGDVKKENWKLLTGSDKQMRHLVDEVFAVDAFRKPSTGRIVHTERIFLVDSEGFIRWAYNGTKKDLAQEAEQALTQLRLEQSAQLLSQLDN